MSHPHLERRSWLGQLARLAIGLGFLTIAPGLHAQQPVPATSPTLSPYRPPTLVLVQPVDGASVPQDRPIVAFRFAPGDSTDPVDVRSFSVSVDGKDRASLFQSARDMAWGPLAPAEELSSLSVGAHAIAARICSIRGACADVSGSVSVAAAATASEPPSSRKRSVMDLLLAAVKKLLQP